MVSARNPIVDYRRDIDGLRAYAVLAVMIFHLDAGWLGGGYVGVDVFFVISGFLITRQVVAALDGSRFSLRTFYVRRLRRLFPAAFVITAVTGAVASFVLPSTLLPELWGSSLFAAISLANVFFWKHSSYFDEAAITKPLLHMWSLGVEEQFYLFWPGLLVLLARYVKPRSHRWWLPVGTFVVGAISLWQAQVALEGDAPRAFFLTHLRAWEFAIGALTSFALTRWIPGSWLGHVLFAGGGAAIVWSAVSYTEETAFPGLHALAPCFGTALLIASARPRYLGWLLDNPVAVGVGRISYSVYLVHWPLIVFASEISPSSLELHEKLGLGAASLLIGGLMWRFVEEVFRHPPREGERGLSPAGFSLACAGLALCLTAVSGTLWANPMQNRDTASARNARMMAFLRTEREWSDHYTSRNICYATEEQTYPASKCLRATEATDAGVPEVLIIGDSMAANLYAGMKGHWAGRVHADLAAAPSCRPIASATNSDRACRSRNEYIWEKADLSHYELVILHGNHLKKKQLPLLSKAISKLRKRGAKQIVLIGPNVEYKSSVPNMIERNKSASYEELVRVLDKAVTKRTFSREDEYRRIARRAKVPYVSMVELRCPKGHNSCWHTMGEDGDPITRDTIHLTRTSAMWTLALIEQAGAPWKLKIQD